MTYKDETLVKKNSADGFSHLIHSSEMAGNTRPPCDNLLPHRTSPHHVVYMPTRGRKNRLCTYDTFYLSAGLIG